jgi:hypothetical protein
MANLNFLLSGRSDGGLNQAWEIRSVHTDVLVGDVVWRAAWSMYVFNPSSQPLDAESLREIAKFLDDQMAIRAQDKQLR